MAAVEDKDPGRPAELKRGWTAKSIGSEFQHRIFYALIRVGGRGLAFLVLKVVVAWYVLFNRGVRERCRFYLDRRFPGTAGFEYVKNCYRLCLSFGRMLVDRAVMGILGPDHLKLNLSSFDQIRQLLAEGKGLIMVTSHVGCWQLGMARLQKLDVPINLLIHREPGDVDRHFFEHGNQASPFRIIDPAGYLGGTLEMLQVLKNQEVLCIMGDRVMGGPGSTIPVEFLGGRIHVPFSPYKLASATGAPIAVLFPYQSRSDEYALLVARTIRVPQDLPRGSASFQPYAAQYVEALEAFVKEFPFQFFNFFDMWTEDPSRPNAS